MIWLQHQLNFKSISKYPSVRRDIALIVGQEVQASDILNSIKTTASDLLLEHFLFDVYEGQGIEENKKSLAIGLIFQDFSRNLTESEVDEELKRILDKLQQDFQAQLRL